MSSRGENIFIKLEVQEQQLEDLRTEVTNLRDMIKVKNEETAKLKRTLKSQETLLNSVKKLVEKCSNQVGEVVSKQSQSTSSLLSGSEPSTSHDTNAEMTSGSSSSLPCLLTTPSFSLKSPSITPVIVSSFSIPLMEFKDPPTDRSTYLSPEAGKQLGVKHHEDPGNGRVARDWPQFDVNCNTVSHIQNVSNLRNFEGNKKKTCVKVKKPYLNLNPLGISPLTNDTDGSRKSSERILNTKKLKENKESEGQTDVEYEVDKIISYKVELGKKLYKVRWSLGGTTWEDVANLTNCNQAIKEFWKNRYRKSPSSNECVRHIRFKVSCQEKDSRGEKVPGLKFSVKETCTVRKVKEKYCYKLNVDVQQLVWKKKILQDDEIVQDLEGEVVTATGVTWK